MRIFLFFVLINLLGSFFYGENIIKYNQELFKKIEHGKNIDELGYFEESVTVPEGPFGIGFDKTGYLYISDRWNRRIVIYDNKYKAYESINNISQYYALIAAKQFEIDAQGNIVTYSLFESCISKIDKKHNIIFNIKPNKVSIFKDFNQNYYVVYKNNFFYYTTGNTDEEIICISNPEIDPEKNIKKILNTEQTKELFTSNSYFNDDGLTLDSKNRLFLNGELLTRNYKTFYNYWLERYDNENNNENKKTLQKYWLSKDASDEMNYLGKDYSGKYYWAYQNNYIAIYNPNESFFKLFEYDYNKSKSIPAVHPSGDVYFLDYDEKQVYLYRVKNVWDPEGRARWYRESDVKDLEPIKE